MGVGASMLLIVLVLFGGGILLQIFLSKRKGKWFGLILPSVTFLYALSTLSIAVSDTMTGGEVFLCVASTLLLGNMPTYVLLGIYFGCREKRKLRAQIDKMKIQDLD